MLPLFYPRVPGLTAHTIIIIIIIISSTQPIINNSNIQTAPGYEWGAISFCSVCILDDDVYGQGLFVRKQTGKTLYLLRIQINMLIKWWIWSIERELDDGWDGGIQW